MLLRPEAQKLRGGGEGMAVGIGVLEAAGVGRDGDVQQRRLALGHVPAEALDELEHDLTAGGLLRVQQLVFGVVGVAAVVVDAQQHVPRKAGGIELLVGKVDRDAAALPKALRRDEPLEIGRDLAGKARVRVQPRALADAPQGAAERGGAAHRVAVRFPVRDEKELILLPEEPGTFPVVHVSSSLSCRMSRELSTSLMCAPYSMLWSISKTSSGV